MKPYFSIFCIFGLVFYSNIEAKPFPSIEVEEMAEQDVDLRLRWISAKDPAAKTEIAKAIRLQEITFTKQLKTTLLDCDWSVSAENILDVSSLILRSSDLEFQKYALEKILSFENKTWIELIPILTDRILLREGLAQRYGTHLHLRDKSFDPYPIENLENVDVLRMEFQELPLKTYIEKVRLSIHAIEKNDRQYTSKLLFNQNHNFYGDPDSYVYYPVIGRDDISIEKIVSAYNQFNYLWGGPCEDSNLREGRNDSIVSIQTVSSNIAFEHPTYAAIYLLRALGWEYEFYLDGNIDEDDVINGDYSVIVYRNAFVEQTAPLFSNNLIRLFYEPCYVVLLPRDKFQAYQYEDVLFNQIFMSPKNVKPVTTFSCSLFEMLGVLGKTIRIEDKEDLWSTQYKFDFSPYQLCSFMFDCTLENEDFDFCL